MIARMPSTLLREWALYDELDPIGHERNSYLFASIVQALFNIARDRERHPKGFPLSDFVQYFGDMPMPAPVVQSVEYQEMLIDSWCFVNNETLKLEATP